MDGVGDGGRASHGRHLAQPLGAHDVDQRIRSVDERHIEIGDVGVHRNEVFSQISVQEAAVARIDLARFEQGRTDPPYKTSQRLAPRRPGADHPATINHGHHPEHANLARERADSDFDEVRRVREADEAGIDRLTLPPGMPPS